MAMLHNQALAPAAPIVTFFAEMPNQNQDSQTEQSWLLAAKVRCPSDADGYHGRTDLLQRMEPLQRLTVLTAPSGFGKTSLLADVCRRWQAAGRLVAWLTLDEDDAPGVLDAYLSFAFRVVGIEFAEGENIHRQQDREGELPHRARRRTELLSIAIEAHAAPCLLALDDLEQLRHREALDTVDFLLQHGPSNLHFALAMRDNPGLDLAKASLDGKVCHLTADNMRFSLPQIDSFFGGGLSLRELEALEKRTEGWPVALRVYRNMKAMPGTAVTVGDLVAGQGGPADWFGEQLLRGLKDEDRQLLLDTALLDWISPPMANELLGMEDTQRRLKGLAALDGLLLPQEGGDAGTWRMNPLLKEYCTAQLLREDPERYRALQRRIAHLEAHTGRVVPALRHANQAGDSALIGELLEEAGGVRLWARFGVKSLVSVDEFLTPEVIDNCPRAALLHCTVLVIKSRFQEAFALFETLEARTRGFERDRPGGNDAALKEDHLLVLATLAGFNCLPVGSALVQRALADMEMLGALDDAQQERTRPLDPIVEGALNLSLCIADQQRTKFDLARQRGAASKRAFMRCGASYGSVFVNLALGTLAMAQGRVREAEDCYGQGAPTAIADILSLELQFERNVKPPEAAAQNLPSMPEIGWMDIYAAAYGVSAEMAFDARSARFSVDQSFEYARAKGLTAVVRFLSALRVSWLVKDGFADWAEQSWRDGGLPTTTAEILSADKQSWREMEAMASARIRLLIAQGEFQAARILVEAMCRTAEERQLRRVLMNGVALSMTTERRLGEMENAVADLADFLRMAEVVDYLRPLARERETTLAVLPALLESEREADVHDAAAALLDELNEPADAPIFTAREISIVRRIEQGLRNDEIARELGLSEPNFETHLMQICRKTGARNEADIVAAAERLISPPRHVIQRPWRGRGARSRH